MEICKYKIFRQNKKSLCYIKGVSLTPYTRPCQKFAENTYLYFDNFFITIFKFNQQNIFSTLR